MKTWEFNISRGPGKDTIVTKTEEELTKEDKDLLFGELLRIWNNQPKENQYKFLDELSKQHEL